MAISILKSPPSNSIVFTDADTDFIITSTEVPSQDMDTVMVSATATVVYFDQDGNPHTNSVSLDFPRLADGWGINIASAFRNFFSRVDMGRAGGCFAQNCSISVGRFQYTFTDAQGEQIDTGSSPEYITTLIFDTSQHGYTDIYRQDGFICLSSDTPFQTNGRFAFSYMQSLSPKTSVYLLEPDKEEQLLATFNPTHHSSCFYNVAGHFSSDTARLEIRSDTGAVLAYFDMVSLHIDSYQEHVLYLPSSTATPELFVCTGDKRLSMELSGEIFDLRTHCIATDSSAPKTFTVNTGYLSAADYERLCSLFPSPYECSLDGEVCWATSGSFDFLLGQKNNVSITFRKKWN